MVVLWCRSCGGLIGLREPMTDWVTDMTGLCPKCAGMMLRDRGQPADEEDVQDVRKQADGESVPPAGGS